MPKCSKMVHFIPLTKLALAKETVDVRLRQVFWLHGVLREGHGFRQTSPIYSQSVLSFAEPNGQSERLFQQLKASLRIFCEALYAFRPLSLRLILRAASLSNSFFRKSH